MNRRNSHTPGTRDCQRDIPAENSRSNPSGSSMPASAPGIRNRRTSRIRPDTASGTESCAARSRGAVCPRRMDQARQVRAARLRAHRQRASQARRAAARERTRVASAESAHPSSTNTASRSNFILVTLAAEHFDNPRQVPRAFVRAFRARPPVRRRCAPESKP